MKYRKLGRTNYEVSEIGFGAWGIGIEVTGGAEGGQTYAVWLTYVNQIGETTPSPPSSTACSTSTAC